MSATVKKQDALGDPRKVGFNARRCPKCAIVKSLADFGMRPGPGSNGGRRSWGKLCDAEAARRWASENREKSRAANTAYRLKHPEKSREWRRIGSKRYRAKLRDAVFAHYGLRCECCGESEPAFLSIDHVNGGGRRHVLSIGNTLYFWLVKNHFPPGFRTLCMNCNFAKRITGICPHKT